MSKDFSKHQKIIDKFRGKVSNHNFDALFAAATDKIPKTEKFLLKMELKRLASPCTRLIDLRGLVDGECKSYEHDERFHLLDDIAIQVFEDNLAHYEKYTFGVYEAVTNTKNNFRVLYQNNQSSAPLTFTQKDDKKVFEKMQYPASFYAFGRYHDRAEERMNYAIPLLVTLNERHVVESTSLDISGNGCKFRFNESQKLTLGQVITIEFVGLSQEFKFDPESHYSYEIKNIHVENKTQLVGVERIYTKERDSFKTFLLNFIQTNKRRYKINLDNTIAALQARTYEQFALPKSSELPVFIKNTTAGPLPCYALTSNNSQAVFQYWQDEKRHSTLHNLLSKDRLEFLQVQSSTDRSLLVYSFIHQNKGLSYFYSADERQFKENPDFMRDFVGFAASKATFSVSLLTCLDIHAATSYAPFTLSGSLNKKDAYLNLPPSEEVLSTVEQLSCLVVINDVTDKSLHSQYQQLSFDKIDTVLLKKFGHKRLVKSNVVDELGINYKNHRQEPRFKYKTPAVVSSKLGRSQGFSCDFSISGLKIELETDAVFIKGDVVQLSFPALQKITSAFDLKNLPYEVIRVNKKNNIINLRVYVKKHQHIGRAFFKLLIEKNKDKLTPDEYANMIPGLAKTLRTLYASSIKSPCLFVQTSGSRYKIETIAASGKYGDLLPQMRQLSDRPQYYNLYPLLNNLTAAELLYGRLKKMLVNDESISITLYVSINHEIELVDKAVTTKLDSEFTSEKMRNFFIRSALKRGNFFCLQLTLSRTEEPDMDYLNPELSYIGTYAIHRGKQIEQDIWGIAGVVQLVDITKEAMIRHQLFTS